MSCLKQKSSRIAFVSSIWLFAERILSVRPYIWKCASTIFKTLILQFIHISYWNALLWGTLRVTGFHNYQKNAKQILNTFIDLFYLVSACKTFTTSTTRAVVWWWTLRAWNGTPWSSCWNGRLQGGGRFVTLNWSSIEWGFFVFQVLFSNIF